MFRKILALAALAFSVSAFAAQTSVDTSGLSEAQVAEIKAIAAKKVAETAAQAKTGDLSPEKVTAGVTLAATWGTQAAAAAEGFAKAMGIAAKELNITINDFLTSPAGMLTAGLIIWKMAGATILHAIYGFTILVVGLTMIRVLYVRLFTSGYHKVEYSRFGGFFKGTKMVRIPKSFSDLENDGEWLAFWVLIALSLVVMFGAGAFF